MAAPLFMGASLKDTLDNGERQVSPTLDGVRRDHRARYEWAAKVLPQGHIIDFACGIGYGAAILADAGFAVTGLDRSREAIEYGWFHHKRPGVILQCAESEHLATCDNDHFAAAVCFETIEHLEDPLPALKELARIAPVLVASVPNEDRFPYGMGYLHHYRHYTADQFEALLDEAGWDVTGWYGQHGPESEVEPKVNGRTLVVTAVRTAAPETAAIPLDAAAQVFARKTVPAPTPKRVVILGLGPSLEMYLDAAKRLGGSRVLADEVWGINALGDILRCDRIFHMDDLRVQESRAAALPDGNIAVMVKWMKTHPGPIYTSRKVDGYPGLVEFPLEEVVNNLGLAYFNSTAAYAVAYAIHIGCEEINLWGFDFTYQNAAHAEKGRACVEFWLGMAMARGIRIGLPENTSLFDTMDGEAAAYYGYDAVKVVPTEKDGRVAYTFEPKALPSAAEVERAYDHTRHTNSHLNKGN